MKCRGSDTSLHGHGHPQSRLLVGGRCRHLQTLVAETGIDAHLVVRTLILVTAIVLLSWAARIRWRLAGKREQAMREVKRMSLQQRLTEEKMLEFLIGKWNNAGRVLPGSFGPGGPVTGETSYHWAVGGRWLLYHSRLELPDLGRYEVHGGVAFNSRAGKYDAYAVNSLGNLLVYEGAWTDENTLAFMLVHPPHRDRARVVYHKLPAGSFRMTSENAAEGGEFVPYFEIDYVRA